MKAYKCDRCGKLFEGYKNQGTAEFFNVTRNPNFSSECLDLCPNCNAELQKWVKNSVEIKTGHWIIMDDCEDFIAKCSECGRVEDSRMISKYPYCHCGAKMEEELQWFDIA